MRDDRRALAAMRKHPAHRPFHRGFDDPAASTATAKPIEPKWRALSATFPAPPGSAGPSRQPRRAAASLALPAIAGTSDQSLGQKACAPRVLGIGRIEAVRGGADQESAVGRTFGKDFTRERHARGVLCREVDNPWDVKNRTRERRVEGNLRSSLNSKCRNAGPKIHRDVNELVTHCLRVRPLRIPRRADRQQRRFEQWVSHDRQVGCKVVFSERKIKELLAGPCGKRHAARTTRTCRRRYTVSIPWVALIELITGDPLLDDLRDAVARGVERNESRPFVFGKFPISHHLPT